MPALLKSTHLALASLILGQAGWATIIIDNYSAATNDRFANDPAFIAAGADLSAVGLNSSGRWGTLVGPNVVVSAFHYFPAIGSSLVFHADNDPGGAAVSRLVLAGERIGDSDVWVGVLGGSLGEGFSPLPVTDEPIANATAFQSSSHFGQSAYLLGRSPGSYTTVLDMALGTNILNDWDDSIDVNGTVDQALKAYQDLPSDPDYTTYEAFLQIGDSGAPLLREVNGTLTVVGLNWFNGSVDLDPRPPIQDLRNLNGFSYLGNYYTELMAVVDAFTMEVTAGYLSWSEAQFGSGTDLASRGPVLDPDDDGLLNFMEYAFVTNPLSGAHPAPVLSATHVAGELRYLQAVFSTRADSSLHYFVNFGSNLTGWTRVDLLFDGSAWTSADPLVLVVHAATDNGNGTWQLTVQTTEPLVPGTPRFLAPGVE